MPQQIKLKVVKNILECMVYFLSAFFDQVVYKDFLTQYLQLKKHKTHFNSKQN